MIPPLLLESSSLSLARPNPASAGHRRFVRIAGVPLYLGIDFLLFLLLLFPVFQQTYREKLRFLVSDPTLLSLASLLLLALLLVLHEWAHILTARHYGNQATAIHLNYFGAVASLEREAASPQEEFLVTFAGPLLNIILALVCTFVHSWAGAMLRGGGSLLQVQGSGLLYEVSSLGGTINWGLTIFNLLPFFPLDGGRLLRSAFWALTGKKRIATHLAFGFTALGVLLFGFFAVHAYGRGHDSAGNRWAAFAVLLAVIVGGHLRREWRGPAEGQPR
ncbi:MAG: site-2 protease family protein [Acidobacteriaceae bacterium]|nr:site-2 protease family protein [Acidobacteriaceae bacterium]